MTVTKTSMFTPSATQSVSSSVPQIPSTIIFNPSSVPSSSYLPGHSDPFPAQSQLPGLPHDLQTQDSLSQVPDLNSPLVFRRSISLALSEINKLQMFSRTVLSNMYVSML